MNAQKLDGYPERFRHALEVRQMSLRQLAARMQEQFPKLRGTSHGGLRLYAKGGEIEHPRRELLEAIATAMDLQAEWLLFGRGPMTAEEAERQAEVDQITDAAISEASTEGAAATHEATTVRARQKEVIRAAILELSGETPEDVESIPYWVEGLVEVFRRLLLDDPLALVLDEEGAEHTYGANVAVAVMGPIEALGIDFSTMRDHPGNITGDYITAITPALLILVRERARQRAMEQSVAADSGSR